ncbi:hypothetical protein PR048_003521 [Dryococelus australis]|uniref:Uncharacterized protein n=1 Tax=Dryococelus australis TaxID=614101 RepID=A0ABQ9IPA1_9NEOP|nr:hypothetical protein PR048_003521 [Dryococelus australis]
MYTYFDVNCALVVCCHSGRRRLSQRSPEGVEHHLAVLYTLEQKSLVHWLPPQVELFLYVPLGRTECSAEIWAALKVAILRADEGEGYPREDLPTSGIVRHDSTHVKIWDRPRCGSNPVRLGGMRVVCPLNHLPLLASRNGSTKVLEVCYWLSLTITGNDRISAHVKSAILLSGGKVLMVGYLEYFRTNLNERIHQRFSQTIPKGLLALGEPLSEDAARKTYIVLLGPVKFENAFSSRHQPKAIDKLLLGAYSIEVYHVLIFFREKSPALLIALLLETGKRRRFQINVARVYTSVLLEVLKPVLGIFTALPGRGLFPPVDATVGEAPVCSGGEWHSTEPARRTWALQTELKRTRQIPVPPPPPSQTRHSTLALPLALFTTLRSIRNRQNTPVLRLNLALICIGSRDLDVKNRPNLFTSISLHEAEEYPGRRTLAGLQKSLKYLDGSAACWRVGYQALIGERRSDMLLASDAILLACVALVHGTYMALFHLCIIAYSVDEVPNVYFLPATIRVRFSESSRIPRETSASLCPKPTAPDLPKPPPPPLTRETCPGVIHLSFRLSKWRQLARELHIAARSPVDIPIPSTSYPEGCALRSRTHTIPPTPTPEAVFAQKKHDARRSGEFAEWLGADRLVALVNAYSVLTVHQHWRQRMGMRCISAACARVRAAARYHDYITFSLPRMWVSEAGDVCPSRTPRFIPPPSFLPTPASFINRRPPPPTLSKPSAPHPHAHPAVSRRPAPLRQGAPSSSQTASSLAGLSATFIVYSPFTDIGVWHGDQYFREIHLSPCHRTGTAYLRRNPTRHLGFIDFPPKLLFQKKNRSWNGYFAWRNLVVKQPPIQRTSATHANKMASLASNMPFANQRLLIYSPADAWPVGNLSQPELTNQTKGSVPGVQRMYTLITKEPRLHSASRLACSPPTEANQVKSPIGSLPDFTCGNSARRCRWSADFLGDLPFSPPYLSGAAPYSPESPSSALKTSVLRAPLNSGTRRRNSRLGPANMQMQRKGKSLRLGVPSGPLLAFTRCSQHLALHAALVYPARAVKENAVKISGCIIL